MLHDTDSRNPFENLLEFLATAPRNSIHYLIGREKGQLYAMVPEDMQAAHAAPSPEYKDVLPSHNPQSIGIEMYKLHSDNGDFTDFQYTAVSQLVYWIRWRWHIKDVVLHKDINPQERDDPRNFDMARFLIGDEVEEIDTTAAVRVDEEIGKAGEFYYAEGYHQQYLEKRGLAQCHIR